MMNEKTNIEAGKAKAGRSKRGCAGDATCGFKQRGIQDPIQQCDKASNRYSSAIQHVQQRSAIGLLAVHERKPWVEIVRLAIESQKRAVGERAFNPNRSGSATKQSKLVRSGMVGIRQHYWYGNKSPKLATRSLRKMESTSRNHKTKTTSTGNKKGSL